MKPLFEQQSTSSPQIQPAVALPSSPTRLATAGQFIAVIVIWSLTPLAAVWTVQELHWAWGLFLRFSIAIPIALLCLKFFRLKLIFSKKAILSYCAGAIGLFGSMAFCYMGADKVPSAIISIIYGASPLVSGLISSFVLGHERFSSWQWLGLGIALVGMSFTLGLSSSGFQLNSIGIMLELIAMLFYVLSTFAVKSVGAHIHPIIQMTGSSLVSWVGYVCLLPFFWSHLPTEFPSLKISLAVFYSAVFSSVLAMIFYYQLIKVLQPTTVLLITIITPVLATFWGTWFNHEHLSSHLVLGLIMLCLGLLMYSRRSA
ncbi:DMT family transporter [Acinetobacter sp. ABJ-A23_2]|uniref:DMT family transporter n=1 Tax=Acinetobacter sp. ABJ-A23_2 TaxID=3376991 RepID=UPI0037C91629